MDKLGAVRQAMARHFGFSDLREGQRRVIEGVMSRRDTLVVLPTGGGKSLCYQLPALVLPGLTVVVSPLIALMNDQVEALRRRGISAAAFHSGLGPAAESRAWHEVRAGQLKLAYLSPERLLLPATLQRLAAQTIALFAIDEAHCVCEWGYDFRPAYLRLAEARQKLSPGVTIALTATATPDARADIIRVLRLRRPQVVVSGFDRPNLHFAVEPAGRMAQRFTRLRSLVAAAAPHACIVYAGTRESVEAVSTHLRRWMPGVDCYHAGRGADERADTQRRFLSGELRVLVATNAFGMGVDKPDVRLVVHLTPPGSIEDYYQEAGRASRDGRPGRSLVLASPRDRELHERFLARAFPPPREVVERWSQLCAMVDQFGMALLPGVDVRRPGQGDLTSEPQDPALLVLARSGALEISAPPLAAWRVRLLVRGRTSALPRMSEHARAILASLHQSSADRTGARSLGLCAQTMPSAALRDGLRELSRFRVVYVMPPGHHVRLLIRPGDDCPVDLGFLRQRAAVEQQRLNSTFDYLATKRCRRWFILRYFCQLDARDGCSNCDNCNRARLNPHGR